MGIPNDSWEITDLNKDYEVIPAHRSHFMHYLLVVINDSPAAASALSQNTSSCWGVADNDAPGELQRHLVVFDPPGKAAEPCFLLEMSTHLLGKASSTLSCFLVFPKPVPPGWWQMWRREGNGSSLDWWGMRQSGGTKEGREKQEWEGKTGAFCAFSVGSSAASGPSVISVWTACCCYFPWKANLDLNNMKQKHWSASLFKILLHTHYFPFYFLWDCVQSDLAVEKQGKQLKGRHQHIQNLESPSMATFFALSSGLRKYKAVPPVLPEVWGGLNWALSCLQKLLRAPGRGHLKALITQRLCLLQWNSQVL